MKTAEESLEVAIDQLIYARQREWSTWCGFNRMALRDLIAETVRPYVHEAAAEMREKCAEEVGRHTGDYDIATAMVVAIRALSLPGDES